jgi:hypothetical protein
MGRIGVCRDDLHDDLIARIVERVMAADAPPVRGSVTQAL